MRGAGTLIPARFLTLLSHLCVLIILLWDSKLSVQHCFPKPHHDSQFQIYHSRLVSGLAASVGLLVIELVTFIMGLTMFCGSVSLTSIGSHGIASVALAYFILGGWNCDWFWPVFIMSSVLPCTVDIAAAAYNLCLLNQIGNEHQHLTQTHDYKAGWSFYLVLAGVVTTVGSSLSVGYNIGVVNTPAEIIKVFCNESFASRYNLPLTESSLSILWSSIVSIFIVGGCTGSILGSVLADRLGRKMATVTTSVLFIIGAMLFVTCRAANSVEMLILGRLIVGLASGLTTSIVPMYLTELAPPHLTGAMGVACPMGVNVGVLVGQVMGLDFFLGGVNDWPYLLSVFSILVIVCLPVLFLLPESPKYLFIIKSNESKSIKELARLRGASSSVLSEELESLREERRVASTEASEDGNWSMARLAADPSLRLPLLLVCSMQAGQQTSGINAVFYYSQTIFEQSGLSKANAQYATIGCGFINVCTAVLMVYLLPRRGRRPLLLASTLSATLFLAALAAAMTAIETVSWMPYICMIAVLLYVLVYGFGLGPIPYFIASEMFEVGPRPAAMAWGSLANWGGNFLVGMLFPTMRYHIGPYSFLVFAVTGALFVFLKVYFPETRESSPTQVSQQCSRGFRSRPLRSALHGV